MNNKPMETYDSDIYMKLPYDDLITFGLFSLIKKRKNASFENIVEETFFLFPSRFNIIGHPEWPDSNLINKSLLRCRSDKKYVIGNNARGYSLTPFGTKLAEQIQKRLSPNKIDRGLIRKKGDDRTKAGKFVKHIEKSGALKLFKENKLDEINSLDFYELIFCTPDSLPQTRLQNFEEILQYLDLYNRDDLKELFEFCRKKFATELTVEERGGMYRRKRK